MQYRAEIDGLRAIAVIPVILFHASFGVFSGGFVGVDIFFVISGYLITTIILTEKSQGQFSLAKFYERRARRILPALFLVMLVSLPFAWLWLLPAEMQDFSQSLIAVPTFSANILFWQETGYWGASNQLKPLLHTWSLAVEEQYYVLFPLFIALTWQYRRRWVFITLLLIGTVSFLISQWGVYHRPAANFFLLPTRAWELIIGVSTAFYLFYKKPTIQPTKMLAEILSILGLILIIYAIFALDKSIPFPSHFALIPTMGTALIIVFSSRNTLIGRVLSTKILVGIGAISYSAYLWHQPLFAFARHRSLTEPSTLLLGTLVILVFLFAYLSWRYIEQPWRNKTLFSKRAVIVSGITIASLLVALGLTGHFTYGFNHWPLRKPVTKNFFKEKRAVNFGLSSACEGAFTLSPDCRTSDEPEILVWGDSFAMHLVPGIIASTPNPKIIQMTQSACGPFLDVAPLINQYSIDWAKECLTFTKKVHEWIKINNKTLKYVVVSSPFDIYLSENFQLLYRDGKISKTGFNVTIEEFKKTLDTLKSYGVTPVVFSPPPITDLNLGQCLAKTWWMNLGMEQCNFKIEKILPLFKAVYRFLDEINKTHHVIRLDHFICDQTLCKTHINDIWLYRDTVHLSHEGSAALGKLYGFYHLITQSKNMPNGSQ